MSAGRSAEIPTQGGNNDDDESLYEVHTGFRSVPKSVTLSDLERLSSRIISHNTSALGAFGFTRTFSCAAGLSLGTAGLVNILDIYRYNTSCDSCNRFFSTPETGCIVGRRSGL